MKDPYTANHQHRVATLSQKIAEKMSLSKEKIKVISYTAKVHDIGKIAVPSSFLNKPAKLSEIKMEMVRTHPLFGYEVLKELDFFRKAVPIVLRHHERIDGSGYPAELGGDKISLETRILAVADVVEAMSSHRPYRPAFPTGKVLREISKQKGRLYDKKVVEVCIRVFTEESFYF